MPTAVHNPHAPTIVHQNTLGLAAIDLANELHRGRYSTVQGDSIAHEHVAEPLSHTYLGEFALIGQQSSQEGDDVQSNATTEEQLWAPEEDAVKGNELAQHLSDVRSILGHLSGSYREGAVDVIASVLRPQTLARAEQWVAQKGKHSEKDLVDWLIDRESRFMNLSGASRKEIAEAERSEDARVLTFLRAHKRKLEERQADPNFLHELARQKTDWKHGIEDGVIAGWYHPTALERLSAIDTLPVYEGDVFSTILQDKGGFYSHSNREVVLGPGRLQWAAKHEFNHAGLQVRPVAKQSPLTFVWLFETVTEEAALAMKTGNMIGQSDLMAGAYGGMRELVRTLLHIGQAGGADVQFTDLAYAYSAPEAVQNQLLDRINQQLLTVFAPNSSRNVLAGVQKLYENSYKSLVTSHPQLLPVRRRDEAAKLTAEKMAQWASGLGITD